MVNSAENAHEKAAGFFTRQRELARQRLWPIALTFLSWLLYHVVCIATALNFAMINAESAHMTPVERTRELRDALTGLLGTGSFSWFMLTVPLAAVLAIEGFGWMDNRQKVDFYESLPLARGVRFRDICTSSFLYFVFSYVITLEIGLAIAGAMGALSHTLLAEVLQQAVNTIALFVSVYALGVLSAMLTGNVIIACLAFGVLLLYETLFRLLLEGYCNAFLAAWDSEFSYFPRRNIFSPVYHYLSRDGLVKTPAELLALADEKGLYLASAPDTFLGGLFQKARELVDSGILGTVTSFKVCATLISVIFPWPLSILNDLSKRSDKLSNMLFITILNS